LSFAALLTRWMKSGKAIEATGKGCAARDPELRRKS
jgi:hypothetical protein